MLSEETIFSFRKSIFAPLLCNISASFRKFLQKKESDDVVLIPNTSQPYGRLTHLVGKSYASIVDDEKTAFLGGDNGENHLFFQGHLLIISLGKQLDKLEFDGGNIDG